jgi:hypothetical protein
MTVPYILLLVLLFALAFVYLLFPKVIQSVAKRAVQRGIISRCQSLVGFVNSKQYLAVVRVVGFTALAAAMFLFIASLRAG